MFEDIRMCKRYFLSNVKLLIVFILLCLLISLLNVILPSMTGNFIDLISTNENNSYLKLFMLVYVVINIFLQLFLYVSKIIYCKLQAKCSFEFNKSVLHHLHNIPYSYFKDKDATYLTQRINSDCNEIIIFYMTLFQDVFTNVLFLVVPFAILIHINKTMVIIVLFSMILNTCIYILSKNKLYKKSFILKEEMNKYFSFLNTVIKEIKFIKINEYSTEKCNQLTECFKKLYEKVLKKQYVINNYSTASSVVMMFTNAILFFLGGNLIINNQMTIGNFTIIVSYLNIIYKSVNYFLTFGSEIQNIKASIIRINSILQIKEVENGDIKLSIIDEIRLDKVNFSFDEKNIITDLSYDFKKGNIYGIKGINGSGKTTLIDIIAGLYTNEYGGQVLYNSIPQSELDMIFLRKKSISLFQQNVEILNVSIKENMNLFNETHSTNMIKEIDADFNIDNIYLNALSGGEKQKIGLARCLSKYSASVFILDEPSSFLDEKCTYNLINYLKRIKNNTLVIMISHDERMLNCCDIILNLDSFKNFN